MRGGTIGTVGMTAQSNALGARIEASRSAGAGAGSVQVVGGGHVLAARDAHTDAGVVASAASCQQVAVPGIGLGRGEAALGVHRRRLVNSGSRRRAMRAPARDSAASARVECGRHGRRPCRRARCWPAPRGAGRPDVAGTGAAGSFAGQDRVDHGAAGDAGRQRPDRSSLGANGSTPAIGTRRAVGL